ncbi:penicillin-binding protein activator, partial [Oleiphilus sp. HI0128]
GIEFIEMPWMLSSTIDIKSQINHAIPESTEQYSRFYALGADSYNIAPRLQLLHEVRGSQMQGHTGMLSMDEQGIINRQLEWAKFRKGKAVTIKE